jgi:hypothetical protein
VKYMLLIYSDPSTFDPTASDKIMGEYMAFTQEIIDSKEMVSGDPLQGPETATTVRVRKGKTATTDGPFVETKEHLGGFYVVDVPDLDRALELAARIPDAASCAIEVRPLMELAG